MTTPKYLLVTDHKATFNDKDKIMKLDSKDIMGVMTETQSLLYDEEELFCACVYEKIPKTNDYKQILRTDNRFSFYPNTACYNLRRHADKVVGEIDEWYEYIAK